MNDAINELRAKYEALREQENREYFWAGVRYLAETISKRWGEIIPLLPPDPKWVELNYALYKQEREEKFQRLEDSI